MKFAKLFDVQEGQVLVERIFDDNDSEDEAPYILKMSTQLDGVTPSMSAAYLTENDRDLNFDNYSQEQADIFYSNMKEQFGDI